MAAAPPPGSSGEPAHPTMLQLLTPYAVLLASVIVCQLLRGRVAAQFLGLGDSLMYWGMGRPQQVITTDGSPSKKQEKKLQAQIKAAQAAPPTLAAAPLQPTIFLQLEFSEDLEYLLMSLSCVAINCLGGIGIKLLLAPTLPFHSVHIVTVAAFGCIYFLAKMEWAHPIIGRQDKIAIAIMAVLGGALACGLLAHPGLNSLVAFDSAGAAEELFGRLNLLLLARPAAAQLLGAELAAPRAPGLIAMLLAPLAAALSGLLVAPGLRFGRAAAQLLSPPVWAPRLTFPARVKALVQLGFFLQVVLVGLWVTPLAAVVQPLLPPGALLWARLGVMAGAGLLQLAAVPYLLQAFLHTTPLHGQILQTNYALKDDMRQALIERSSRIGLTQAAKVALQLSAVPALLLMCSGLYGLMAFASPLARDSPLAGEWDRRSSTLFVCLAGFVGWWANLGYLLAASYRLLAIRLNVVTTIS